MSDMIDGDAPTRIILGTWETMGLAQRERLKRAKALYRAISAFAEACSDNPVGYARDLLEMAFEWAPGVDGDTEDPATEDMRYLLGTSHSHAVWHEIAGELHPSAGFHLDRADRQDDAAVADD